MKPQTKNQSNPVLESMLPLKEVKALPVGKGIRVENPKTGHGYNALITDAMTDKDAETNLRLITERGQLTRPMFANYGKTWVVAKAY